MSAPSYPASIRVPTTGGDVEGEDVLATGVTSGHVLTAQGDDTADWQAPSGGGGGGAPLWTSSVPLVDGGTGAEDQDQNLVDYGVVGDTVALTGGTVSIAAPALGDIIELSFGLQVIANSSIRQIYLELYFGSTYVGDVPISSWSPSTDDYIWASYRIRVMKAGALAALRGSRVVTQGNNTSATHTLQGFNKVDIDMSGTTAIAFRAAQNTNTDVVVKMIEASVRTYTPEAP